MTGIVAFCLSVITLLVVLFERQERLENEQVLAKSIKTLAEEAIGIVKHVEEMKKELKWKGVLNK